jgi:hypothetical protein
MANNRYYLISPHNIGTVATIPTQQFIPVDSNKTKTDHAQDQGHGQSLTINYENDGRFVINEQRFLKLPGETVPHRSLQNEHENLDKKNIGE